MRPSRAGFVRCWSFAVLSVLGLSSAAMCPSGAIGAEAAFTSTTYVRSYERELGGNKDRFLPVYEYLSGDATQLRGDLPLSFHFSGWGRLDLGERSENGRTGGDFDAAFLDYRHPNGNGEARLGRFFVADGSASDVVDGVFLKGRTPLGFGASLLAGKPVEQAITTPAGGSIFGSRIFYARPGFAELGASALVESGDFVKNDGTTTDRKLAGGDMWVRPASWVEFHGDASYNVATKDFVRQRYSARLMPGSEMDLLVGYESYLYEGLFQQAINPVFRAALSSFDNNDKVRTMFAIVSWQLLKPLTLEGEFRDFHHQAADPGNGRRAGLGLRYAWNDRKDQLGASVAVNTADHDRDEYSEYRLYGTWTPAGCRFAIDLLQQRFKERFSDLSDRKDAFQAIGAAGYSFRPDLSLSADLTYTKSPRFNEDYVGMAKLVYAFNTAGGGK